MQTTISGGKFLSEDGKREQAKAQKRAETKAQRAEAEKRRGKFLAWFGLVICDSAFLAMILNGLIDDLIGMLFLIGISAAFGRMM